MIRRGENPMTSIWLKALRAILVALVGSLNYDRVEELVVGAESSGLSGEEKRQRVIQEARSVSLAVGTALLNLAIEAAVNGLRK